MTQPFPQLPPLPQLLPRSQSEWTQLVNVFQNWQAALQPIYGQTAAELAAGVNPANTKYAPGDVRRYGAVGDGVTDDHASLVAALSQASQAGGVPVLLDGLTYLIGSPFTIGNFVTIRGSGIGKTTLKRGFTGDFITSIGTQCALYDLTIDGDTANRGAGRGIIIPSFSFQPFFCNVMVQNFSGHCVDCAANGGSELVWIGGGAFTTASPGTSAAILVCNGTDSAANPRKFFGLASNGCTLYDFGGANDTFIEGGYTNGLIFSSSATFGIRAGQLRCGVAAGPVTIDGTGHKFTGSTFAVAVTLAATSNDVDLGDSEVASWAITDNANSNNKFLVGSITTYASSWTADTTNPTVGNSTFNTALTRKAQNNKVQINITIGSSFSAGSGQYFFSLPYPANQFWRFTGTCRINHAGTFYSGTAYITATGLLSATFGTGAAGDSTPLSNAHPVSWAAGDTIDLEIEYVSK